MTTPTPQSPGSEFSQNELEQITAETFVERVSYHTELNSTNTQALKLAGEQGAPGATLVLAERQTAGRGRGENCWWSGLGALTFSVLLPAGTFSLATGDWPKVSLVTGLAVADALDEFAPGESARLKWPNDVYLRNRKVCGILVEGVSGGEGVLVIGIGINVNNSLDGAPDDVVARAIAVSAVTGEAVSRAELLIRILNHLEAQLQQLSLGGARWQEQWRDRCLLTDRKVLLDTHSGGVAGICRGIDENGALLIDTDAGLRRFLSGVVAQFE